MNRQTFNDPDPEIKHTILAPHYEIFIIGVSLLQLVNSVFLFFLKDPNLRDIVLVMFGLCAAILLVDCVSRASRPHFWRWQGQYRGWLIIVGSVPAPGLIIFRMIHTLLAIRLIRRSDLSQIGFTLVADRAKSTFLAVIFIGILILEFASMGVLALEQNAATANIISGQDAIWWSIVTIATVGYGDRFPVTGEGRLVGALTMTVGVGVFSVLTGFISDWFRSPRRRAGAEVSSKVNSGLDQELAELQALLDEEEKAHERVMKEIRERLAKIEKYK